MALLNFKKSVTSEAIVSPEVEAFLQGYSIEAMPRTASGKIQKFKLREQAKEVRLDPAKRS